MYLDIEGIIVLGPDESEHKESVTEFIFVKIPGLLKYTDYVELVINYEPGQCPYTEETFKEYIESQKPMLIREYSRQMSEEINMQFSKYIQDAIKCQK